MTGQWTHPKRQVNLDDFCTMLALPQLSTRANTSMANTKESMNLVLANQSKVDSIYPLITREIAEAEQQNNDLKNKLTRKAIPPSWSKTLKNL